MNISDEKLGAFLDQELPDAEMAAIRDAIRVDPTLATRLASLASADALLKRHAAALDSRPMPSAVLAMLKNEGGTEAREAGPAPDNVISLSRWQEARRGTSRWLGQHAALAAGIALVVGFTGGQFLPMDGPGTAMIASDMNASIKQALDTAASGETLSINDNINLLSRFSFTDNQARHCRQFLLQQGNGASENIACRIDNGWELVASAQAARIYENEYQTASGSSLLDSTLDAMMMGSALSLDEENTLIQQHWQ